MQPGLTRSEILGIGIDPKTDNLIQLLVEDRQKIKQRMKGMDRSDPEHGRLESRAQAMKILVNAMSYGIFIELNPEDHKTALDVYGLGCFSTEGNRFERPGHFSIHFLRLLSHPPPGCSSLWQRPGCRLGVPMHTWTQTVFLRPWVMQTNFQRFPTAESLWYRHPILKLETGKVNVWFCGISSKRYALYRYDSGEIDLIDYKTHGLGHLLNPYPRGVEHWHAEIWRDLLCLHYREDLREEIMRSIGPYMRFPV